MLLFYPILYRYCYLYNIIVMLYRITRPCCPEPGTCGKSGNTRSVVTLCLPHPITITEIQIRNAWLILKSPSRFTGDRVIVARGLFVDTDNACVAAIRTGRKKIPKYFV